jgi:hypothetical protein
MSWIKCFLSAASTAPLTGQPDRWAALAAAVPIVGTAIVALLTAGCISSNSMKFPVISTNASLSTEVPVIGKAQGNNCPEEGASYGDYAKAFRSALATVPGANALTDVELRMIPRGLNRVCVEVIGNAVHL